MPHIDGSDLKISIPKMTNSGKTIEVRGKGLPRIRGSGRGDVVALVKLHMPKKISKADMKLVKQMDVEISQDELEERVVKDAKERRQ